MLDTLPVLTGDLVTPDQPEWDLARRAWNLAVDQRPALVALPADADDVLAIVEYAIRSGLKVAPQGTGHNASAIASLEDTILLSTQRMRGVEIDTVAETARVQAGTLWLVRAPCRGAAHVARLDADGAGGDHDVVPDHALPAPARAAAVPVRPLRGRHRRRPHGRRRGGRRGDRGAARAGAGDGHVGAGGRMVGNHPIPTS